jgi:hypothetical protein
LHPYQRSTTNGVRGKFEELNAVDWWRTEMEYLASKKVRGTWEGRPRTTM